MPTVSLVPKRSMDTGRLEFVGDTYPPPPYSTEWSHSTADACYVALDRSGTGVLFYGYETFIRWDTSLIPSSAIITNIAFKPSLASNNQIKSIYADWHPLDHWPPKSTDRAVNAVGGAAIVPLGGSLTNIALTPPPTISTIKTPMAPTMSYTANPVPGTSYPDTGGELSDGVRLEHNVVGSFKHAMWSGWNSGTPVLVFDLGAAEDLKEISIYAGSNSVSGIKVPTQVKVEVSTDGSTYATVATKTAAELGITDKAPGGENITGQVAKVSLLGFSGQFVRVTLTRLGGDWIFLSEVTIEPVQTRVETSAILHLYMDPKSPPTGALVSDRVAWHSRAATSDKWPVLEISYTNFGGSANTVLQSTADLQVIRSVQGSAELGLTTQGVLDRALVNLEPLKTELTVTLAAGLAPLVKLKSVASSVIDMEGRVSLSPGMEVSASIGVATEGSLSCVHNLHTAAVVALTTESGLMPLIKIESVAEASLNAEAGLSVALRVAASPDMVLLSTPVLTQHVMLQGTGRMLMYMKEFSYGEGGKRSFSLDPDLRVFSSL